jgi:dihydrofolate reductase
MEVVVAAIVAMDDRRVIGNNGALPWHIPEDMARFKTLTMGHVVIMGRKTWDSLPLKFRPLPGRVNIVVTRTPDALVVPEGVEVATSPIEALERARVIAQGSLGRVWIVGGAEVYRVLLAECSELHVTHVEGNHVGDAFLAPFEESFREVEREPGPGCAWVTYRR